MNILRSLSRLLGGSPADPIVVKIIDTQSDPQRPDLIEVTVDGLDEAKDTAVWLTKGVYRTQPATAVLLKDCTDDHLTNILLNKPNLSADYRRVIEALLTDRGVTIPVASLAAVATATPVPFTQFVGATFVADPTDADSPVDDLNKIS